MPITKQSDLDTANSVFWNEPCSWQLMEKEKSFEKMDTRYFNMYPFLKGYLDKFHGLILEAGTGYGTVASYLAQRCMYRGLDIAQGPIDVLTQRGLLGKVGNVLELPHADEEFDGVVCVGVLHHTGNIQRGIDELLRVTKTGGRGLFMLYNAAYGKSIDRNRSGEDCPHTDYTREEDIGILFSGWDEWKYTLENGKYQDIYIEAVK